MRFCNNKHKKSHNITRSDSDEQDQEMKGVSEAMLLKDKEYNYDNNDNSYQVKQYFRWKVFLMHTVLKRSHATILNDVHRT